MAIKYCRIIEVIEICGVDERFVLHLEQERVIEPITRRNEKLYPLNQIDRIRVAHLLMQEMGLNLEGVEVALHMREQMIAMQRQFDAVLRSIREESKKNR